MIPTALPLANLTLWVTPLWLLGLGIAAAAIVLAVLGGLLWLVRRPAAEAAWQLAQESVLAPIGYVLVAFLVILVVAWPIVPADQILESARQLQSGAELRYSALVEPEY